jgi:uncharacterized protein YecE (DUF72 family)
MIEIGCCGYPVNTKEYQETFEVVELNSTFYKYPKPQTVKKWRKNAPKDFEFTVKAHQDITHKYKMNFEQAQESLEKVEEVCQLLNAEVLLFQTPASFKPDKVGKVKSFFERAKRDGLTLVWEPRGPLWETDETREKLRTILEELGVSHVTDPFRYMPVYTGKVAYLRLHGHGERMYYYQYSNEELENLHEKTRLLDTRDKQVYVFFNNLTMLEDAQRFHSYVKSASFPRLKISGKEAVKIAISKTRYPTTKSALLEKIGWKLVELEDQRQVKMAELLDHLSHNAYDNPEAVLQEISL